jgi:hypothetical protein
VPWLDSGSGADDQKKQEDDNDLIDVSELGDSNQDSTVDSPVTSGSDPSSWDPIAIDGNP